MLDKYYNFEGSGPWLAQHGLFRGTMLRISTSLFFLLSCDLIPKTPVTRLLCCISGKNLTNSLTGDKCRRLALDYSHFPRLSAPDCGLHFPAS